MIRLATLQDIPDVVAIYDALHTLEERGKAVIGWQRGVYPTRKHAMEALEAGQLYVDDQDGLIQAAAKINQTQEPAYFAVSWAYPAPPEQVLVMHTLVVSPAAQARAAAPGSWNSIRRWPGRWAAPACASTPTPAIKPLAGSTLNWASGRQALSPPASTACLG